MRLPGLIDVHVHTRDPGAPHKEDWESVTAAGLAGGFTQLLGMPNTQPSVVDEATMAIALDSAAMRARCDYGQFIGATADNAEGAAQLADRAVALKLYLCDTYGSLLLDKLSMYAPHLERWPANRPICVHATGETLGGVIELAGRYDKHLHVCHLPTWSDLRLVMAARERAIRVTCEVAPHHLLLSTDDLERLGPGRCEVRPRLATPEDCRELWAHIDEIDCIATDHAPHTLVEKDGQNPPPGYPTLEQSLALMLTAVHQDKLSIERLVAMMADNPRRLFSIEAQPETWIEIDPEATWQIPLAPPHSRAGWTPFAGFKVRGRVERVVLRGKIAYDGGVLHAEPGTGQHVTHTN